MNHQLGNLLKNSRDALSMTQETLAGEVGVSTVSVSQWERGESEPSEANLQTLVDIYGESFGLEYLRLTNPIAKRCLSGMFYKPDTPREIAYLQGMTDIEDKTTTELLNRILHNGKVDDDEIAEAVECVMRMKKSASQRLENVTVFEDLLNKKMSGENKIKNGGFKKNEFLGEKIRA